MPKRMLRQRALARHSTAKTSFRYFFSARKRSHTFAGHRSSSGGILVIGLGLLGVSLSVFSPTTDGSPDHFLFTDRLSHDRPFLVTRPPCVSFLHQFTGRYYRSLSPIKIPQPIERIVVYKAINDNHSTRRPLLFSIIHKHISRWHHCQLNQLLPGQ